MSKLIAELIVSIPDLQSACSLAGDGSARIKLDLPESELPEVIKLMAFGRNKALRVMVYESEVQPKGARSGTRCVRSSGGIPGE